MHPPAKRTFSRYLRTFSFSLTINLLRVYVFQHKHLPAISHSMSTSPRQIRRSRSGCLGLRQSTGIVGWWIDHPVDRSILGTPTNLPHRYLSRSSTPCVVSRNKRARGERGRTRYVSALHIFEHSTSEISCFGNPRFRLCCGGVQQPYSGNLG